ncbi:hypothetical protein HKX48_008155 [Thoreauomyces humboldtii]|nr:hypothetical protein HKX48_008155 [Thoreauomyces humboldtii]
MSENITRNKETVVKLLQQNALGNVGDDDWDGGKPGTSTYSIHGADDGNGDVEGYDIHVRRSEGASAGAGIGDLSDFSEDGERERDQKREEEKAAFTVEAAENLTRAIVSASRRGAAGVAALVGPARVTSPLRRGSAALRDGFPAMPGAAVVVPVAALPVVAVVRSPVANSLRPPSTPYTDRDLTSSGSEQGFGEEDSAGDLLDSGEGSTARSGAASDNSPAGTRPSTGTSYAVTSGAAGSTRATSAGSAPVTEALRKPKPPRIIAALTMAEVVDHEQLKILQPVLRQRRTMWSIPV